MTSQLLPTPPPTTTTTTPQEKGFKYYVHKAMTKDGWIGDYDFGWLCMPTLPFGTPKRRRLPPFFALHADLPLALALVCGFQHALAMLAGLITPPIVFASALNLDGQTQAYMISASLIGCGELYDLMWCEY
jgi:hypothetical protein